MLAKIKIGNVIEHYTIENTKIFICNDACTNKTKLDIDSILIKTSKIAEKIKTDNKKYDCKLIAVQKIHN